jgi:hypothetical protein
MIDPNSPRAAASRRNGARSKGPRTAEGKARSSMNALKHGLTARRWMVLYDEDTEELDALIEVWAARFAPAEPCEALLVRRLAEADWRLRRASRIEFEMFDSYQYQDDDGHNPLALALIRDGHGANAFGNLLRYRGGAEREFHRLYKMLSEAKARREAEAAEDGFTADTPVTERAREPQELAEDGLAASAAAALAAADRPEAQRPAPAVPEIAAGCETNPSAAATAALRPIGEAGGPDRGPGAASGG